ncbi:MAG: zinc ABC transporter substrate-binding protein [Verrucomicrobiales bacterium]|jgi:zinc/manganese transport system substrate-binding protein|nr:zinc ABC transporter substrate-binding protein [Verrucomicrobiales bacterium]
MKNKSFYMLGLVTLFALLAGSLSAAEKLKIVASFLPMYAHTKSIVGELAEVQMLIGSDAEPHDYQFKPSDVKKIAAADLFVINGAGLEEWLGDLLKKAGGKKLRVVDTSAGIELLDNAEAFFTGSAADEEEEEHEHGEKNPHVWLDPVLARRQVQNILAALTASDPKNAAAYKKNADTYLEKLHELDESFRLALTVKFEKRLVTFHDAFPYLAKRYGFVYLGCITQFPGQDPKPRDLQALVQAINKHGVKVIFAENGYSPKLLEEVARQTGAKAGVLDTLEIGAPSADAYLVRMRKNLAALGKVWKK